MKLILITSMLGILMAGLNAQAPVEGRVLDGQSSRPLAFVNIVYKSNGEGTVSNIDGAFSIRDAERVEFLKCSYLGYEIKTIPKEEIVAGRELNILLDKTLYNIKEVKVLPGVNPAHRIIRKAEENRDLNNPEKMRSFSYASYSKIYFTAELDSASRKQKSDSTTRQTRVNHPKDSTETAQMDTVPDEDMNRLENYLEKQHIFLMEFVSDRMFLHPDKNRETVTASRVSGLKDPSFTLLASQMQSFSFYDELFMIWDQQYVNPISRGSTRRYLFVLEDTTYTQRGDSLFVISFRPLRGKNFDGLQGILHINSHQYAVQNVVAEAAESDSPFRVKIQQQYELVENTQWFPVQLNTDFILKPDNVEANGRQMTLLGIGKSYLSDISLNPELQKRQFNHVEQQVDPMAHRKTEEFWEAYRVGPLTAKDSNTYHLLDSLGEAENFDRTLRWFETFVSGYIPVGFLNLDYRSLFHWNQFEGFRLGAAAETNERISHRFQLGGKIAYGTRDGRFKYGGHLRLNLNRRKDAFFKVGYDYDVTETAGWHFLDKPPITSSEYFRSFLIARKHFRESVFAGIEFPAIRYMKIHMGLSKQVHSMTNDYRYRLDAPEGTVLKSVFPVSEFGLRFKYAFKEKFMETPRGNRLSLGTSYPILYANIHVGLPWFDGEYEYTRLEAKITKTLTSKSLGKSRLALVGGWVDRSLPYPFLYTGPGSYTPFTVETENSFATMRLNEFLSERFVNLHFQQDFGSLIFKEERFQPGIVLAASAGFSEMADDPGHVNLDTEDYSLGYYETGILFNNLLRQWFIGYGLGVFYRMGPYTLPKTIDNFAFKFTIRFNI